MKLLAAAFLLIALACVQGNTETRNKAKQSSQECFESTGVDHEIVRNARKGEFVEDAKLMKYCHCVYKKLNIMDGEGHFDEETLIKYVPENIEIDVATKITKKCIEQVHDESDHEKKCYRFYKCFVHSAGKPVYVFKN